MILEFLGDQFDFYFSGQDHHLNDLTHPDSKTRYLVCDSGTASYLKQKDKKDFFQPDSISHYVY